MEPDEARMARYAVSMADAQAIIEMAIGGKAATTFYEGERTFDVRLRFKKEYRDGSNRYVGVGFSIRDRDLGSTIAEAQKKVSENVKLKAENKSER